MKNKVLNRIISVILCVTVVFSMLLVATSATAGASIISFTENGINYEADFYTKKIKVVGYDKTANISEIVIPSVLRGYPVTTIGERAFEAKAGEESSLVSVVLSEGITSIENSVFLNCTKLSNVVLPESLLAIGEYAFSGCKSLENIKLPEKLWVIDEYAFKGCSSLKSVLIPDTVSNIKEGAFQNCTSLATVNLPTSEGGIDKLVFSGCTSLKSVFIPKNYRGIYDSAFEGCSSLSKVTIEKDSILSEIHEHAFSGCESLASIDLPKTLKTIYAYAFYNCYRLSDVTLREGLEVIHEFAFANCSLREIEIPCSVEQMGYYSVGFLTDEQYVYLINDFTIYGITGSVAELYADTFEFKFMLGSPVLSGVVNTDNGLQLSFYRIKDANGYYRIYRKTADTSWEALGDIVAQNDIVYFTDKNVDQGVWYTYTVKFIAYNGTTSRYNKDGVSTCRFEKPIITNIENIDNGIKLTWAEVPGSTMCRVYVKTDDTWNTVEDSEDNTCEFTNVKPGQTYTFTVKAFYKNQFTSTYNTKGWSIKYIETPKITSVTNALTGAKITWNQVAGAENYRVYVKNGTSWKGLGNTTSNSFIYTGALSGVEQIYTVRCVSKDGNQNVSGYDKSGYAYTYLAAPKVTKIQNTIDGAQLSWDKINGASKYRVYVNTTNGWKSIADTTDNFFVHTDAISGSNYSYTLKAFDSDGAGSAHNSTGWSNKFIATPVIKHAEVTNNGVKLTWDKVQGGEEYSYRIFIKNGSSWKTIGTVSGNTNTYTDKTATAGNSYIYTVRCIDSNNAYVSAFDSTGYTIRVLETPKGVSFKNTYSGIVISWTEVAGAQKYRVYIRNGDSWTKLADTNSTSFTHKGVEDSKSYTYTVRCITSDLKVFESGFNSTGFTNTYIEAELEFEIGDINGDGKITILDATLIQRHIAKLDILTEEQLAYADADRNDTITIKDATQIQRLVAKLITQL